jgi:hypothetical protein
MPSLQQRQQARTEELFEFPITGPFGGIQSELPPTEIEPYGFQDSTNMMFRRGVAYSRPGYTNIYPPLTEPILGVVEFFNAQADRISAILTPTRLLQWTGGTFVNISGAPFTGSSTQLWSWDIVGQKLCFSQGSDPVWLWDGISSFFLRSSSNAVAANYLAEIDTHLVVGDTIEGGTRFPQRYRWTGIGDPTDWTSFNAGFIDVLNNLGPINGIEKLGQYGYGFHQSGIIQIIPTGSGTNPFDFVPIVNCSLGNICPHSLDHFNRDGVEQAVYVGSDNVYVFNQSSLIPIGDNPIDGRKRLGARSRIFSDLSSVANQRLVFGYVTNCINGTPFNAYWLSIPNVSMWVYNFDEGNWTRFAYPGQINTMGSFYKQSAPRIMDLVGTILAQNWTPATLGPTNPFDGLLLGFNSGFPAYVDFTNNCETPWQIIGPKHTFGDSRHKHSLKKFRLSVLDLGPVPYTVTITNESNFSLSTTQTLGTGSGDVLSYVFPFNISGTRLQWQVSGPAEVPGAIVEFCPMFDISGEQRSGTQDTN